MIANIIVIGVMGSASLYALAYLMGWLDMYWGRRALRGIQRDYGPGSTYYTHLQTKAEKVREARFNEYIDAINKSDIPVDPNSDL